MTDGVTRRLRSRHKQNLLMETWWKLARFESGLNGQIQNPYHHLEPPHNGSQYCFMTIGTTFETDPSILAGQHLLQRLRQAQQ